MGQRWNHRSPYHLSTLEKLNSECELETLLNSLIIVGITDNRLREHLLRGADLTLERCIQLGHAAEQTKLEVEELKREVKSIDKISQKDVKHKLNQNLPTN